MVQFVIAAAPQDLGAGAVRDISVAAIEIDVSESCHSVIASHENIARVGRESVCRQSEEDAVEQGSKKEIDKLDVGHLE